MSADKIHVAGREILGAPEAPTNRFALRKRPTALISEESATDQILTLLEYYDIDVERMPKEDQLDAPLKQLTDYVRRGSVEIGTDNEQRIKVTINLADGKTSLELKEIGARHKLVMDRVKDGGIYSRVYALMASLAGLPKEAIEKLHPRDLAVIEVLGVVFLAA